MDKNCRTSTTTNFKPQISQVFRIRSKLTDKPSLKTNRILEAINHKYTRKQYGSFLSMATKNKNKKPILKTPLFSSPPPPPISKNKNKSYLVLLMPLQKSLSTGHIFGHFISRDDGLDVADPRHQVTEVCQESVQVVGVIQTWLAVRSLL